MMRLVRWGLWAAAAVLGLALLAVVLSSRTSTASDGGSGSSSGTAAERVTVTSPGDLDALAQAPPEVVLSFSGIPDPAESHVATWDSAGTSVNVGEAVRGDSRALHLPLAITTAGNYTVAYHVVFASGTELVGSLRFSVGTGVAPPVPDAATRTADETAIVEQHVHTIDPLSAVVLIADGVVLVVVMVLLIARRPRPDTVGGDA